jgi:hypothetical protein
MEPTWKRYRTPQELKSWLSRGSWLVHDRISLEAVVIVQKGSKYQGTVRVVKRLIEVPTYIPRGCEIYKFALIVKIGNVDIWRQNRDEDASKRAFAEVKGSSRLNLWSKAPDMN